MSPKTAEKVAFMLLRLAALFIVVILLAIIGHLVKNGWSVINWEFLTSMPRRGMTAGGIWPAILGTVYLVSGTIAVALPLGVMAAIYLTEYAGDNFFTRMVRLAVVNLAGVPSIVFGLFGLGFFVILLGFGASILAGSLTLAIMVLPIIITTTEESLKNVPMSYRQASLALGATKWQTIWRIVLPQALPGIMTGSILGISRAAGETAPILFTAAAFFLPRLPGSIFDQVMALPYHLYIMATQVPGADPAIAYGTALTLMVIVLGLNFTAVLIRLRFRKKTA
jgi:phosphate transport system permease protein